MKTSPLSKGLLALVITTGLSMTSLPAQNLDFLAFETEGARAADIEEISLAAHLLDTGTGVEIRIANTSTPGDAWVTRYVPTITTLFFEDAGGLLIAPSFNAAGSIGIINYTLQAGGNLPGGNNIGFDTLFAFKSARPPVVNGVDPNETASFLFEGSSYVDVMAALNSGDIRIGAHVQQIGECAEDSASFVTQVPEPGTTLLALLGTLLVLRRRR